jgi:copper chaperone CopZ
MKTRMLSIVALMVFTITTVTAQSEKKEKMEVAGNCGLCKTRIENAAKSVEGVSSAEWNKETKILEVRYDSTKINIHMVHMAVAKAGHDTKMHKASDEVYNQLPGCCKYERLTADKDASHGSDGHKH